MRTLPTEAVRVFAQALCSLNTREPRRRKSRVPPLPHIDARANKHAHRRRNTCSWQHADATNRLFVWSPWAGWRAMATRLRNRPQSHAVRRLDGLRSCEHKGSRPTSTRARRSGSARPGTLCARRGLCRRANSNQSKPSKCACVRSAQAPDKDRVVVSSLSAHATPLPTTWRPPPRHHAYGSLAGEFGISRLFWESSGGKKALPTAPSAAARRSRLHCMCASICQESRSECRRSLREPWRQIQTHTHTSTDP